LTARVINLARERRCRDLLVALRAAAARTDPRRTASMLAGELDCPGLEEVTLTEEKRPRRAATEDLVPFNVRLPRSLLDRVARMAEAMEQDPEVLLLARGRVSSAATFRLALLRGLAELEREHGIATEPDPGTDPEPSKPARKGKTR